MIGTDDGYWFSMKTMADGDVDYEFYRFGDMLESGVAPSEDEMWGRFEEFQRRDAQKRRAGAVLH